MAFPVAITLYRQGEFSNKNSDLPAPFTFNQNRSVMEDNRLWHLDTDGAWETYGRRTESSEHVNHHYRLDDTDEWL